MDMAPEKPLPLETLMPFKSPQQGASAPSAKMESDEHQDDADDDSQQEDEVSDPGKQRKRPKRSRACIACRNMKIRCLPVEGQEACLGCSKVNRECIMPGPARKRQKTVHKVAELEKKINALTDALIAKSQANPTPPSDSPASARLDSQSDITRTSTAGTTADAQRYDSEVQRYAKAGVASRNLALSTSKLDMAFCPMEQQQPPEPYVDVIERGMLDFDTAAAIFNHYNSTLRPLYPVISFPSYVKASDVRTARPMVFLAILTVTSPAIRPDLQHDLVAELSKQLSERVMFMGEKSLELVQAMLLYTTYYTRSRYAKDLAFNQYIHAAAVMCLDLGMGKRYPHKVNRDEVEEAEVRRTWLACYYFATNVSILLRHPTLVRWTPYIEESVSILSKPDALPGDRWLASLCSLIHIGEEVSIVFSMDDPTSPISFMESKTQYHLKAFEKQLAQWKQVVPPEVDKRLVEHLYGSINLYIHEIAIHHDHNVDDFRMEPFRITETAPSGSFVTPAHVDALTTCLDSSHRVLNSYLKLDLETSRSTPNLVIVWNTYAEVALIKLHGVLNAPDSMFGSIFMPDLKVDYYLDAIIRKLQEVSANSRWPPAEAFVYVTKKLRSWHSHKRAPYLDDGPGASQQAPQTDAQRQDRVANNVLQGIGHNKLGLPEKWGPQNFQTGDVPIPTGESQTQNPAVTAGDGGYGLEMFGASQTSDLNAAYHAANYNLDWNDLNFSQDELNVMDNYMNDQGWMGYLI
jgi:hypothetical protein